MGKGAKIAIGVILGFMVCGLGVCGAGYLWFQANKDDLKAKGTQIKAEAEAFGVAHTQPQCLEESLGRLDQCGKGEFSGITCKALAKIFLQECLGSSTPSPNFCDGVPLGNEILDIATWSVLACADVGRDGDQACGRLMQAKQEYCNEAAR